MAFMFARLELHNAQDEDFDNLHSNMARAGFHRRMRNGGVGCDLPWGYYASDQYDGSQDALAAVQIAIERTGKTASTVVSRATDIVSSGLKNCRK